MTVAEGERAADAGDYISAASMGPQLDSCGRMRDAAGKHAPIGALQWGRNLTVAEGSTSTWSQCVP